MSFLSIQVSLAIHAQGSTKCIQVSQWSLVSRFFNLSSNSNALLISFFSLYAPLLGELKKDYIRNFAAESFAFIMRKMNDKDELFNFLFDRLSQHPEVSTICLIVD